MNRCECRRDRTTDQGFAMIVHHPALDRRTALAAATAKDAMLRHLEGIRCGLEEINRSSAVATPGAFDALDAVIHDVAGLDFAAVLRGDEGPDAARLRAAACELARLVGGIVTHARALYGLDEALDRAS
jgi:hypothetical protein